MENWSERQRNTNRLIRKCTEYLLDDNNNELTAEQIYGLCRLTWITKGSEPQSGAYLRSTKIPALNQIFGTSYAKESIQDIAADIALMTRIDELKDLIENGTGFTNFYNAYRNSSFAWIKARRKKLEKLIVSAYNMDSDEDGLEIIQSIEKLPVIPRANQSDSGTGPQNLLTPLFFSLDKRLRFPLINGNKGIQTILSQLEVNHEKLGDQYKTIISLIGKAGIDDASDLDQHDPYLYDLLEIAGKQSAIKILETKETEGKKLPIKDEEDYEILAAARNTKAKRLHNKITNRLKEIWASNGFKTYEGDTKDCMFDILVSNYDNKGNDLMIEVKSDITTPSIRMAVGQSLYYKHVHGKNNVINAIVLPEKPQHVIFEFLDNLGVRLLWLSDDLEEVYSENKDVRLLTT